MLGLHRFHEGVHCVSDVWGHLVVGNGINVGRGLRDLLLLLVGCLRLDLCGGLLGLFLFLVVRLGLVVPSERDLVLSAIVRPSVDESCKVPLVL